MKVFNLTDVPTPTLESYSMLNQTIAVGAQLALPGEFVEIAADDESAVRTSLEHFLSIGAVAFDTVPDAYKEVRPAPASPLPVRQPVSEGLETPPDVSQFAPLPMRGFAADTPPEEPAGGPAPEPAPEPTPDAPPDAPLDAPPEEPPPAEPAGEPPVVKRSRRKE
jgi:hypothetical protein